MLNKPMLKSLTVWGLIVFAGATPMLTEACQAGAFSAETCATIAGWIEKAGLCMTALGIRRAVA